MKKSHKIIVALIFLITILLIIFLSKDFIIRKYFISLLENVDYDEYILELSINGKKSAIYYYAPEYAMERNYDDNENLDECIIISNYLENSQYYYYFENKENIQNTGNFKFSKPSNLNNELLLNLLRKDLNSNSFKYKGITIINNKPCYILEFKDIYNMINTIYLDKELLYTVKIDTYLHHIHDKDNHSLLYNEHIIYEYTLDLTLDNKSLFELKI